MGRFRHVDASVMSPPDHAPARACRARLNPTGPQNRETSVWGLSRDNPTTHHGRGSGGQIESPHQSEAGASAGQGQRVGVPQRSGLIVTLDVEPEVDWVYVQALRPVRCRLRSNPP